MSSKESTSNRSVRRVFEDAPKWESLWARCVVEDLTHPTGYCSSNANNRYTFAVRGCHRVNGRQRRVFEDAPKWESLWARCGVEDSTRPTGYYGSSNPNNRYTFAVRGGHRVALPLKACPGFVSI